MPVQLWKIMNDIKMSCVTDISITNIEFKYIKQIMHKSLFVNVSIDHTNNKIDITNDYYIFPFLVTINNVVKQVRTALRIKQMVYDNYSSKAAFSSEAAFSSKAVLSRDYNFVQNMELFNDSVFDDDRNEFEDNLYGYLKNCTTLDYDYDNLILDDTITINMNQDITYWYGNKIVSYNGEYFDNRCAKYSICIMVNGLVINHLTKKINLDYKICHIFKYDDNN